MLFDYQDYYTKLNDEPLYTIIFATILILSLAHEIYVLIRKTKGNAKRLSFLVTASVMSIMLLFSGFNRLNLSIRKDENLPSEEMMGTITAIDDVKFPPKFYYQGHVVWPKLITIAEEQYFIMTIGDYEAGDVVVIEYLPNSKVVVSIS